MGVILFGALGMAMPVFLVFSIYFLKKDYSHWRKYLWMYICLIGLLAYSYAANMNSATDYTRYIARLDEYQKYTLSGALSRFYYREIGENVWVWLVSKSGCPGLLSGIPTLIVYAVSSFITYDYAERNNMQNCAFRYLVLQFCLLPFASIVNNIFCVSAFSLVVLAAYRELIQRKRDLVTLALYIIPCFIQQAAALLVLLRLLAVLFKKTKALTLAIVFFLPGLIGLLYRNAYIFTGIKLVYNLIERAGYYLFETAESEYANVVSTNRWHQMNFFLNMMFAVGVLIFIYFARKSGRDEDSDNSSVVREETFETFVFMIAVLAVACTTFSAPHYWRFNLAVEVALPFIFMQRKYRTSIIKMAYYIIWISALGQLLIQLYRLRSFVIFSDWITNFLLESSPFVTIAKIISSLWKGI